mmetsp:Transcript_52007/g.96269  ORF Transcript_52007/g.96269 Transcript_52007/m.96269 type:complete len:201 (+) Transcript_52007:104-706(+)
MGAVVCCQSETGDPGTPHGATPHVVDLLPMIDDENTAQSELPELSEDCEQYHSQKTKLRTSFSLIEQDFRLDLPDAPETKKSVFPSTTSQGPSRKFSPPPIDTMTFDDGDFVMTLERGPSNFRVGFRMHNSVGEDCIRIRQVYNDCLAHQWNLANPAESVQAGDAIVRVNGQSDPDSMRKCLGDPKQTVLKIAIQRGLGQ